jgi:hypothetical protein
MIKKDVARFDISMYDTLGVRVFQSAQDLPDIEPNGVLGKHGVQSTEFHIPDIFHHDGRCLSGRINHIIMKAYNKRVALQQFKDLDLPLYLLTLHCKNEMFECLPGLSILMTQDSLLSKLTPL